MLINPTVLSLLVAAKEAAKQENFAARQKDDEKDGPSTAQDAADAIRKYCGGGVA